MNCYDNLYKKFYDHVPNFSFDHNVVSIFENMIERSIPSYRSLLKQIVLLVDLFFQNKSTIYDMGCSTGTLLDMLILALERKTIFIEAVDSSEAMIEKAQLKLNKHRSHLVHLNFHCDDMCSIPINNASIVILNFSLQFIELSKRNILLKKIYDHLLKGGLLIVSEKINFTNSFVQDQMTQCHNLFKKKQGYSDLEIIQKRKSLEKILIPDTLQSLQKRLTDSGFHQTFQHFQSLNFVSFLAIK